MHLLSSFVSNRFQQVRISNSVSNPFPVLSGVPQGSVLGPLLFLIFVADLPTLASFGSKLYQFADDLKLMRHIRNRNDEISMQNDIWKITEWSSQWRLDLNLQKCKVKRYGGGEEPSYFFDEDKTLPIEPVNEERDLGVIFDKDLTFSKHIKSKIATANSSLYFIRPWFCNLEPNASVIFTSLLLDLI